VDVLLVNPPWYKRTSNIWRFIDSSMPPLGLASIAACLRKHDVSVDIVDFAGQGLGLSDAPRVLAEYEMSWLGITAGTPTIAQAETAKEGETESAYSEEEKEAVREHLRSLGYLG
jgi:hypothetical protein